MNIGIATEKMKLDSGHLALDFSNTVGWHASDHPVEKIQSYQELIEWGEKIKLITAGEATQFLKRATGSAKETQKTYARAIALREAIYRIFSAHATGKKPDPIDLELLNAELSESLSKLRVSYLRGGFQWEWREPQGTLDSILWPILRSAAELLNSPELALVGRCEDDRGCGWLFIDTSHNRSRRWCGTNCGNRAKVRRFRERQREASQ